MKKDTMVKLCTGTVLFLCCYTLSLMNITQAKEPSKNIKTKNNQESYLFTQSAKAASLEKIQGAMKGYKLTLKQINAHVSYFSERPTRKTGVMPVERFLKLWEQTGKNNFRKDPPNAELHVTHIGADNKEQILDFAVELTNPKYDKATETLTYHIQLLPGNTNVIPPSGQYQQVTLFIDDACLSCW